MLKPIPVRDIKYKRPKKPSKTTFFWCPVCRRPYSEYYEFKNGRGGKQVEYYNLGGLAGDKTKTCPECREKQAKGIWNELKEK